MENQRFEFSKPDPIVEFGSASSSSSDSDSDSDSDLDDEGYLASFGKRDGLFEGENSGIGSYKKQKHEELGVVLPLGFLDPLPPDESLPPPEPISQSPPTNVAVTESCKQFRKAGDYKASLAGQLTSSSQKHGELGVVLPLGFLDPLRPDESLLPLERISQSPPTNVAVTESCKQFRKAGDCKASLAGQLTSSSERRERRYSYSPSPPRGYGRRGRSPSPRGRYGGRSRDLPTRLLVRNLPHDCRPEDLRRPFGPFGPLKDIYLPRDHTGEPRGFGFVEYMDPADAAEAKYQMDGRILHGRELTVIFAEENRKKPADTRARERVRSQVYDYRLSPRYCRSPRYARSRSRSPIYCRPSPRRRSISRKDRRHRDWSYSRSPSIHVSRCRSPVDYSKRRTSPVGYSKR
ncbi:uncharacterized protein LOC143846515 isoform X2 [Tasmannia lanceolata]|uniref:uncharacterized protein LOC143846515 isoform X2 n=1 Tax=Tasmannia lanceolata TaxID=3420 RepID=UPI0040639C98